MATTQTIHLSHHMPEGIWTVSTTHSDGHHRVIGGMFTSAEAALMACWLTTDERIELPAIASYRQVQELFEARSLVATDLTVEA